MSKKQKLQSQLSHIQHLMPWISVAVLAGLSCYFLILCNPDVLFMEQMLSLFNGTAEFYNEQFAMYPGGLLQWAGCFMTQFFYYPLLGAALLLVMWIASFFLMKKALSIPDTLSPLLLVPFVCLLLSQIDLGYWIYYNYNPGYCFSSTLGILAASIILFAYHCAAGIKGKYAAIASAIVCTLILIVSYRYLGVYALATSAALAVLSLVNRRWGNAALFAVAAILTPFLFRGVYEFLTHEQLFLAALPEFIHNVKNETLVIPLEVALASMVLLPSLSIIVKRIKTQKVASVISLLLIVFISGGSLYVLNEKNYDDANYHAELQAYRAIDEGRWDDAVNIIEGVDGTLTRQNIMFKHVALFNTHEIGERMYDSDEKGMMPTPADSLAVNTARTSASLIYLHHGMVNYAYHWSMENQVEKGFDITNLKIMALSSIISGERTLAKKYLGILSRTLFYKDWAERYMPLANNPKLIKKYPELANIHELHSRLKDYCGSDEGLCENYLVNYFSKSMDMESKCFQEMTLVYSVIFKGIKNFWPHYVLYTLMHKGERVPAIYQQAAIMFFDLEPQSVPDLKKYGILFDKEIIDRYRAFDQETQRLVGLGMSEEAVANMTETNYGNTFWWSYYFKKNANCY